MANRVFITGYSALTSCGETASATWDAVLAGQSGIDHMTQWDLTDWPVSLGGELKQFQPAKMLPDRKLMKVISRQDVMGIHAAVQAVEHSQMIPYRDTLASATAFDEQTGVYVGSPGNKYFQQYDFLPLIAKSDGDMQAFAANLFNEVHPMWLLRILPNNVLAYTGITYGFKGPNHNVTNHAVGGTQALLEAFHAIQSGQAERAVVVAYDMGIEPQALYYYDKLGVVSSHHLKPFDRAHDGTILADGAAALILESEASASARAATRYGEIVGGLSGTEASGLFSIEDDGAHLTQLLQRTLHDAGLGAEHIDLVTAHGNGNKKSDLSEAQAIQQVFGQSPVTAFKWAMGHTLCASGLVDTVLATLALANRCAPGIANLSQVSSGCAELNVHSQTRPLAQSRHAVVINRGFASMNACVVIKACE